MRIVGFVTFLPILALLAGCAGSPVGDAMNPQGVADREDGYCQSIGAQPGSPEYINCRLQVGGQRQQAHSARILGAAAIAQSMQPAPARNCTSTRFGDQIRTTCY